MAKYTNSPLVVYTKLSPNYGSRIRSSNPNGVIRKITLHHMAGNLTVEVCGNVFAKTSRQASSNYGVGSDGRIGMYVEEKNRPWTSSSGENDAQAVTVEVANNSGSPKWTVSDKALASTIDLCEDVCRRNNIGKLTYTGKLEGSNMTKHQWFASTACPGPYLGGKFAYIAEQVNARLQGSMPDDAVEGELDIVYDEKWYRVRKSWEDADSQVGAYRELPNAKKCADKNEGYFVFDWEGNLVYPTAVPEVKPEVTPEIISNIDQWMWNYLSGKGLNDFAIAGIIGNIKAESNLCAINLQNTYETKLGYTDETYTTAVDNGTYTNFVNDKAGYGFCQWTYCSRKEALLAFARAEKKSIGSPSMQMDFFWKELQGYTKVMNVLKSCTSVQAASDIMLMEFERPASIQQEDTCAEAKKTRAQISQTFYDKFATKVEEPSAPKEEDEVKTLEYAVNDIVSFKGGMHYTSPNGNTGHTAKACRAKVTHTSKNAKHPYHLRGVDDSDNFISGYVYGWVDSNTIERIVEDVFVPYTVKVAITNLNIRKGPGTNYDKNGITGKGIFTIIAEADGQGATKWGKLKSNLGWIALDYTESVGKTEESKQPTTKPTVKPEAEKTATEAELEAIARRVIRGEFGNGDTRKKKLAAAGYAYDKVQAIVDQIMSGTYKKNTAKKSNEEIAREVLKGIWGNGQDRVKRLTDAGYDPKAIQAIVNKL